MGRWAQARKRGSHTSVTACTCDDPTAAQFNVVVTVALGVGSFSVQQLESESPCFGQWSAELDIDGVFAESSGAQAFLATWVPVTVALSGSTWAVRVVYLVGTCPESGEVEVASGEVS